MNTSDYASLSAWFNADPSRPNGGDWIVDASANSTSPDAHKRPYTRGDGVTSAGTGLATVTFSGVASTQGGGNVQVVSQSNARCKVTGWGGSGDLSVGVACFTPGGAPINAPFSVSYYRETSSSAGVGYVWADQPSTASYTPASFWQFNSTSQSNTITRSGTGAYAVFFPGLTTVGGTVDVTAYGSSNAYCKVVSWAPSSGGTTVNVKCWTTVSFPFIGLVAAATDSLFTLSYGTLTTHGGVSYAYTWSGGGAYQLDRIEAPAVAPHAATASIQTTRTGVGAYQVYFPDISGSVGFSEHVTAYGSGSEYCTKAAGAGSSNTIVRPGLTAYLSCFNAFGSPVDTSYVISVSDTLGGGWTPFTSEEYAPATCFGNSAMYGAWCTGSYCDNVALDCEPITWDESAYWTTTSIDHSADYFTPWFSEEGSDTTVVTCGASSCVQRQLNQGFCGAQEVVTGVRCSGSYCDNMGLQCSKLVGNWLDSSRCRWTGWISEEQNAQGFGQGFYALGAECSGSYCDNVRYLTCPLVR